MVLVDKKMLGGGIAMISVGLSLMIYLGSIVPLGTAGMSEEQALDLLKKQQENRDYTNLAAIVAGIGLLLVLISFGVTKRKGDSKMIEKKPPA